MSPIVREKLQSDLLQREIPYAVILPNEATVSGKQFPVLYLLHGLFGSFENWVELTDLLTYAESSGLIIVLVEGGNNWYSDSVTTESDKFESYFFEELLVAVESLFPVDRTSRAVAGLSMGGYGAYKFAIKYPRRFSFAGSMSGAFIATRLSTDRCPQEFEELLPSIEDVFGEAGSSSRAANDIFQLISRSSREEVAQLPYFYLDCGLDDSFLETNQELARLLREKEIRFDYYEEAGAHDWIYWNEQLEKMIQHIREHLPG